MDIIWFKDCFYGNKHLVGGKNASLGELLNLSNKLSFNIADGFAITVNMYDDFINQNHLLERIKENLNLFNESDEADLDVLNKCSDDIKSLILSGNFTKDQVILIYNNYDLLHSKYHGVLEVAVRSSAIAEDLPNASFAGQQDTFLNVNRDNLIYSVKKCFASLFNARAISYRKTNNIEFSQVKMSIAVQKMIRSDLASAGVAFSIDPETGYDRAVVINSAFGLGELVVSGGVKPDEIVLDKRCLESDDGFPIISQSIGEKFSKIIYSEDTIIETCTSSEEEEKMSITNNMAIELGKVVYRLETHYKKLLDKDLGLDTEWAIDGLDGKLYIIQARPETIHSNSNKNEIVRYVLKDNGEVLIDGVSVGEKISTGKIKCLKSISEYKKFNDGDILVTEMTTPDWEPIMKKSSGIITDKGGRTCHAAIVARELGINAIVGTSFGSRVFNDDMKVTMSCAEGETGKVYNGFLKFDIERMQVNMDKKPNVKLMLNVGSPENAFSSSMLPNDGVGLARLEFIINNYIKIHPLALFDYPNVDAKAKSFIEKEMKVLNISDPTDIFVKRLAMGLGKIASAFYPNPVIVRLSDFKSNEYKNLLGGSQYEPNEENPMIGWRGASRYYHEKYRKAFDLECKALYFAREHMKMTNIIAMIPFCRTPDECAKVVDIMAEHNLIRGVNDFKVYIMCEIPSNVIEADRFSEYVDGVSIGGNDLLQLTIGVDRDSDMITDLSNHRNVSYRRMIEKAIIDYKGYGVKVGFCGQQPSDSEEFAEFLTKAGINSISVTPDSLLKTYKLLSN